jgi:ABC-type nitrate/sulfonate/bicarbonate transport system ATPase subunit
MRSEAEAPAAEPRDVEAEGVEIVGAAVSYGAVAALGGVTLCVAPGEIVAVAGPSGCGKTTLLELVCGLVEPDAGGVRAPAAALMPQRDALLPWLSALDNAALALRVAGVSRAAARAAAHEHFAAFGLEGFERARPAALSGGMRQRVAFLRTLLAGRPLLCLDEPFGALDALTRLQMQRWLEGALAREPRTVLLVTHDVEEAVLLADRVVLLSPRPGRIVDEIEVGLPRPRARDDRAVIELRERALAVLGGDEAGPARPANDAFAADEARSAGRANGASTADDRRWEPAGPDDGDRP